MQILNGPDRPAIALNVQRVRERIAHAAQRAGRDPSSIRLMAVSKFHPVADMIAAYNAGVRLFGENRVQEAVGKRPHLPPGLELHLIGHLQRNKARDAAITFDACQSIDRIETATELSRRLAACNRSMRIMLEVNTSHEATKSGVVDHPALRDLVAAVGAMPNLRLEGLMTIGPLSDDEVQVRSAFAALRACAERLRGEFPAIPLVELSMGMSGDLEWAIYEGSTMVRVGTALFGARGGAV